VLCLDVDEGSEMGLTPVASDDRVAPAASGFERQSAAQREIQALLLRIRGLVFVRSVLEGRGASELELERHRRETDRLRSRLAALVAGGGPDAAA